MPPQSVICSFFFPEHILPILSGCRQGTHGADKWDAHASKTNGRSFRMKFGDKNSQVSGAWVLSIPTEKSSGSILGPNQ